MGMRGGCLAVCKPPAPPCPAAVAPPTSNAAVLMPRPSSTTRCLHVQAPVGTASPARPAVAAVATVVAATAVAAVVATAGELRPCP